MFDTYTEDIIEKIPRFEGLDIQECKNKLSLAYLIGIQLQLGMKDLDEREIYLTVTYLRKLVNSLELLSIFGDDDLASDEEKMASAFVSAQGLELIDTILVNLDKDNEYVENERYYAVVEAGLLYMIAGYEIDALSMINKLSLNTKISENKHKLLDYLNFLCGQNYRVLKLVYKKRNNLDYSQIHFGEFLLYVEEVVVDKLLEAMENYVGWLTGENKAGLEKTLKYVDEIIKACESSKYEVRNQLTTVYHITNLFKRAVYQTSKDAVYYRIINIANNKSNSDILTRYLRNRASVRPFLWPSTKQYLDTMLEGNLKNCVVSMPTGSGKSFIAELGVVLGLINGWVLYIAPTNALVSQVKRDLRIALRGIKTIEIVAYISEDEYTTFNSQHDVDNNRVKVMVMTPEKCIITLRNSENIFKECALCVFDECHLLNDNGRGITSEILLAQLINISPNIKFLLMSAMLQNVDQIAQWLKFATGEGEPVSIKWRPSRTIRGMIGINGESYKKNVTDAEIELMRIRKKNKKRKNESFNVDAMGIFGLHAKWDTDDINDYKIMQLPIDFTGKVSVGNREKLEVSFLAWKNDIGIKLSAYLSKRGIQVINFILTSRHHAFSSAKKCIVCMGENAEVIIPDLVKAYLLIAEEELGVKTILTDLLKKGVSVHSSSMLVVEQLASEYMFTHKLSRAMFATGTLAEGLNMPAIAVIVSGTSIGDSREVMNEERINSLILNSFGRAGRAGFSNQGIAVLIPDRPFSINVSNKIGVVNIQRVVSNYPIMREEDSCIKIKSHLEKFVTRVKSEDFTIPEATREELQIITALGEYAKGNGEASTILAKSYAGYVKREIFSEENKNIMDMRIEQIRDKMLEGIQGLPEWIGTVALKTGRDIFSIISVWKSFKQMDIDKTSLDEIDMEELVNILIKVLKHVDNMNIFKFMDNNQIKSNKNIIDIMIEHVINKEEIPEQLWDDLKKVILAYVNGDNYIQIYKKYYRIEDESVEQNSKRNGGEPIPSVFTFIKDVISEIAIYAGVLLAILEMDVFKGNESDIPSLLKAFPLCIKHGCNSMGTLMWFQYGYSQRICAHRLQQICPIPRTKSLGETKKWISKRKEDVVQSEQLDGVMKCMKIIWSED
ncbi:MAG: box helicase [Clostridia bacterium]|jgi:superfamily II DNA/RNA helicase|nr:box helicase [Clostridia bacterium]